MSAALLQSDLPFPVRRGKVRDVYDLGESLLIIATDRISAFDVVMNEPIPGKGKLLTAMSLFWFQQLAGESENHLISADIKNYPRELQPFEEQLADRSMWVRKAQVIPIECVARGYLAGSAWKEYQQTTSACGVALPAGLIECEKLPAPIFTPATKEESGHDQNISFDLMSELIGESLARELREKTLRLYSRAAEIAHSCGIIIADTKFEFGIFEDRVILIDEIITPDSSRFWPADDYSPGRDQPSFDKQFLRNWLAEQTWNKQPPPPTLPADVIAGTRARYEEAFRLLTSRKQ